MARASHSPRPPTWRGPPGLLSRQSCRLFPHRHRDPAGRRGSAFCRPTKQHRLFSWGRPLACGGLSGRLIFARPVISSSGIPPLFNHFEFHSSALLHRSGVHHKQEFRVLPSEAGPRNAYEYSSHRRVQRPTGSGRNAPGAMSRACERYSEPSVTMRYSEPSPLRANKRNACRVQPAARLRGGSTNRRKRASEMKCSKQNRESDRAGRESKTEPREGSSGDFRLGASAMSFRAARASFVGEECVYSREARSAKVRPLLLSLLKSIPAG